MKKSTPALYALPMRVFFRHLAQHDALGGAALGAQVGHHFDAVPLGHKEIQHDHIRPGGQNFGGGGHTVGGIATDDAQLLTGDDLGKVVDDGGIVFQNVDPDHECTSSSFAFFAVSAKLAAGTRTQKVVRSFWMESTQTLPPSCSSSDIFAPVRPMPR